MTAGKERDKQGPPPDIEHTHAFGGMQFMSGEREEIDIELFEIDRHLAHRLYRIGVKEDTPLPGHPRHLGNGKDDAGFVIGPHDADDGGIVGEGLSVLRQIEGTVGLDRETGDPGVVAGQPVQVLAEILDRRMLDAGCDDMPFFRIGLQGRQDGGRIAFRAATGKGNLARFGPEKGGNLAACPLNRRTDLTAKGMHA